LVGGIEGLGDQAVYPSYQGYRPLAARSARLSGKVAHPWWLGFRAYSEKVQTLPSEGLFPWLQGLSPYEDGSNTFFINFNVVEAFSKAFVTVGREWSSKAERLTLWFFISKL